MMTWGWPRWCHRLYAQLTGKFWGRCPECREHFGGHEWLTGPNDHISTVVVWDERASGALPVHRGICPACTEAGVGCLSNAAAGRYHLGCKYAPVPPG